MKKYICDVPECNNEAWYYRKIKVCSGYYTSTQSSSGTVEYTPFERPTVKEMDLCSEHYKMWCKATYLFYERDHVEKKEEGT
jgi:hypothetical protein